MQKYVNQLLEDIQAAHQTTQVKKSVDEPFSMEAHFEDIEQWISGEPEYSFSTHCGLKSEQFPPVEQLTEVQLKHIYSAFDQLLNSWNLGTDIPENFPISLAYPLLVSTLNKKVDIVSDGFITMEFCTCDPASCPFDEYCGCKKFNRENDGIVEAQGELDPDIPF